MNSLRNYSGFPFKKTMLSADKLAEMLDHLHVDARRVDITIHNEYKTRAPKISFRAYGQACSNCASQLLFSTESRGHISDVLEQFQDSIHIAPHNTEKGAPTPQVFKYRVDPRWLDLARDPRFYPTQKQVMLVPFYGEGSDYCNRLRLVKETGTHSREAEFITQRGFIRQPIPFATTYWNDKNQPTPWSDGIQLQSDDGSILSFTGYSIGLCRLDDSSPVVFASDVEFLPYHIGRHYPPELLAQHQWYLYIQGVKVVEHAAVSN